MLRAKLTALLTHDSKGGKDGVIWKGFPISLGQEKFSRVAEKLAIRLALDFAFANNDMADEFAITSDCMSAIHDVLEHYRGRGQHQSVQAQQCARNRRALEQVGKRGVAYAKAHDDGLRRQSPPGQIGLQSKRSPRWCGGDSRGEMDLFKPSSASPHLARPNGNEGPWLAGQLFESG